MAKNISLDLKIDSYDSKFFNKKVGRLDLFAKKTSVDKVISIIKSAKTSDISFIVVKLLGYDIRITNILLRLGFILRGESIDLEFKKSFPSDLLNFNCTKIDLALEEDLDKLKNIARTAFRLSYLYKCGFSSQTNIDYYHAKWIENLSRDRNIKIFVVKVNLNVVGFCAVKLDRMNKAARIILIATKKKYRQKGIGSVLLNYFLNWAADLGINKINVKTQKENGAAFLLYKKFGFKPILKEKIFCLKI